MIPLPPSPTFEDADCDGQRAMRRLRGPRIGGRSGPPKKSLLPASCEVNRRDLWLSLSDVDGGGRYSIHDYAATAQPTCSLVPAPGFVNASSLERCLAAIANTPGANVAAFCEPPRRQSLADPSVVASTALSGGNQSSPAGQRFRCLAVRCSPLAAIFEFRTSAVALRSVREAVKVAKGVWETGTRLTFEYCDVRIRTAFAYRSRQRESAVTLWRIRTIVGLRSVMGGDQCPTKAKPLCLHRALVVPARMGAAGVALTLMMGSGSMVATCCQCRWRSL